MRIGLLGDTHGDTGVLQKIISEAPPVDSWFHTGDYCRDARLLASLTGLPVLAVRGNCDSYEEKAPWDQFVTLEGHALWVTHGHKYLEQYKNAEMAWWAQHYDAKIVVFGHTHVPTVEVINGILVINPGSPARPRGGAATYGLLTLQQDKAPQAQIREL